MLAPYAPIKNAPYDLWFFAKDTSGQVSTGGTSPSATRSLDGAAFASCTNSPAETPASSGQWKLTLTAAEMACDILGVKVAYTGPRTPEGMHIVTEPAIDSGVAQAGAAGTITLRAGAPATDLAGLLVEIVRGTGASSRARSITAYNTASKVATVRPNFATSPDSTSVYKVYQPQKVDTVQIDTVFFPPQAMATFWNAAIKGGTVQSGSSSTVIKTNMTGYGINQFLRSCFMNLGTNSYGIPRAIIAYDTDTGDITINPPLAAVPTNGDGCYVFGTTG